MTNKDAVSLLHTIVCAKLTVFDVKPENIIFDTSLNYGVGYLTVSDDIKSLHDISGIHIGIRGLDDDFNLRQFTRLTKTVFHELQHANQEMRHKCENSLEMYSMGLTYITCLLYDNYYHDRFNYCHNLKEIDAEYEGLKSTYRLISELFTEDIGNECICNFILSKTLSYQKNNAKTYYIPLDKSYNSVSDIYSAFEIAKNESIHVHRNCDFWKNDNELGFVFDEMDGIKQDEMIVSNYFQHHVENAEYIRKNTIALQNL